MNGRLPALLALLLAVLSFPVDARIVTDSAGRSVEIPDRITRVFAAGPPASVLLYVLAPEKMIGWVRAPRESEKPFLLPARRQQRCGARRAFASGARQARFGGAVKAAQQSD